MSFSLLALLAVALQSVGAAAAVASDGTGKVMRVSSVRPPLWPNLEPQQLLAVLGDPPDRYRPVPWLAWTGDLDWATLRDQLAEMKQQGITEFFLFPIYGMELPYMSAPYFDRVRQTLEFCRQNGMRCWIYDEYNWPSGVCAGMVLRDHPEACEELLWLRRASAEESEPPLPMELSRSGGAVWGIAKAREVRINSQGADWVTAMPGYLATLDREACRRFIESTHERYRSEAPGFMPDVIPGFFTDEPGPMTRMDRGWVGLPFARDLFDDFEARYGYDLRERLADLLADSPSAPQTRCQYWRLVAERFGDAYGRQQREWCDAQGIALTGHCLGEESLVTHVRMGGDLWEAMRHFTIPGIDLLGNADGYTYPDHVAFYGPIDPRAFHLTLKYVHAIVRHSGAREMMSEAYGVSDWGMNLARQKRGFHYQVALGVTLFNDNSLVTSIADFRKYAIAGKHFTQPWWPYYRQYADYNARLAALHAEGEPVADIAVLYPRSAVWAATNEAVLTGDWYRAEKGHPIGALQDLIYDLLDTLIRDQYPFDFIFEPVLGEARIEGTDLVTPHARYRALVLPSATDLPGKCMEVVRAFAEAGGVVVIAGDPPQRDVDSGASLSAEAERVLAGAAVRHTAASGAEVRDALAPHVRRPIVLSGQDAREFVSSWRRLAGSDLMFVANMADRPVDVQIEVLVPGPLLVLDPSTMQEYRPSSLGAGHRFSWHFEPWQAFVLIAGPAARVPDAARLPGEPEWLHPEKSVALDGAWDAAVERGNMLRLTCEARPDPENRGWAEGWHKDKSPEGWIQPEGRRLPKPIAPADSPWYWLRARVVCEQGASPERLVLDSPDFLEAYVNGRAARQVVGQPLWTEENVQFDVRNLWIPGENWVHIRARTSKYNDPKISPMPGVTDALLQPAVLVGRFRVGAEGNLAPWEGKLVADAPWEEQGLPHFAGTVAYRRELNWSGKGRVLLHLPGCRDSVEVRVNGQSCGVCTWAPYLFDLSRGLRPGPNALEIRVSNTLGHIILETYAGIVPTGSPTSGLTAPPRLLVVAAP